MEQKIVLTGIARSKGKAAGEALVNRQRMGWAFNHVGNEDGIVLVPGADIQGKSVIGKVVVYPTVMGSTTGAISLYYKCTQSHHGPAAIICQKVHDIDISGAIAGGNPRRGRPGQGPDHDHQDRRLGGNRRAEGRPEGHGHDHAQGVVRSNDIGNASIEGDTMAMKLTKHQQEMLDGKHGEAKKFCMEKLMDFGEAVEAKEMVDLVLVLNCCPIYSKDRTESRDEEETRDVRSGTQPALRSDLRDEGRPRRGRNGHPVRKRSVPGAVRQGRREGLPLELRASGQGQLQDRRAKW